MAGKLVLCAGEGVRPSKTSTSISRASLSVVDSGGPAEWRSLTVGRIITMVSACPPRHTAITTPQHTPYKATPKPSFMKLAPAMSGDHWVSF